jgi:hypothetical protein
MKRYIIPAAIVITMFATQAKADCASDLASDLIETVTTTVGIDITDQVAGLITVVKGGCHVDTDTAESVVATQLAKVCKKFPCLRPKAPDGQEV